MPIKHNDDEGTPSDWYQLLVCKHVLWVLIIIVVITCFVSAVDANLFLLMHLSANSQGLDWRTKEPFQGLDDLRGSRRMRVW